MPKEAVFTMKLEPELRAEFMAEAEAADRPASQILREMMREYIQRQRNAREYETFLSAKVAKALDILPTAKAGGFLLRDAHARARECSLRH